MTDRKASHAPASAGSRPNGNARSSISGESPGIGLRVKEAANEPTFEARLLLAARKSFHPGGEE